MSRFKVWAASGAAVAALATGGVLMFAPTGSAAPGGAAPKGVPECRRDNITASYKNTDAAMSHRFGRLKLKNTSEETCWIKGYGGLSYVGDGNGTQIGAPADRTPSPTPLTVLAPGDKVRSAVSETVAEVYDKSECQPTKVDGFRVYIPDETHSIFIAHVTTGCKNTSVHLLQHKAYR
jgi:hypothetical protein